MRKISAKTAQRYLDEWLGSHTLGVSMKAREGAAESLADYVNANLGYIDTNPRPARPWRVYGIGELLANDYEVYFEPGGEYE
jgi:hypothetical protein